MAPGPIVENFDVVKHPLARLLATFEHLLVDLSLERIEEAFDDRVVKAIALAAHARGHAELGQTVPVVLARVLGGFNWSSQHLVMEVVGEGS